jgi:hypothetical protein
LNSRSSTHFSSRTITPTRLLKHTHRPPDIYKLMIHMVKDATLCRLM